MNDSSEISVNSVKLFDSDSLNKEIFSSCDEKSIEDDFKVTLKRFSVELEEYEAKLKEAHELNSMLKDENTRLKAENTELREKLANLENQPPQPSPLHQPQSLQTMMEEDELDLPLTPSKRYPRQSIGQWSVERAKRNMSVKSMVNSMERQKSEGKGRNL